MTVPSQNFSFVFVITNKLEIVKIISMTMVSEGAHFFSARGHMALDLVGVEISATHDVFKANHVSTLDRII